MDKINFSRERYRLGHTLVFFRAGALAGLEEARDELVLKWLRMFQGEVRKRIRAREYQKRANQRELIAVCQRNLRKYMALRDWGWFVVIQRTRPMIGKCDPNEELKVLEEKAAATYGVYIQKVELKEKLLKDNKQIEEDKKTILKQIEAEQGSIGQYHERLDKAAAEKAAVEAELAERQRVLSQIEQDRIQATNDKKALEAESALVKKDIADMEMNIQKIEQEKTNRDHVIKSLNEEIAYQDEIINKLNKEKKHISESNAKFSEDLQIVDDKVKHLYKVKEKLEATLDELEASSEREKRGRIAIDKERRKLELELKLLQESVADLERSRKEFESQIGRKDADIVAARAKLNDEQALVGKIQKTIKEHQSRIEVLEEELEAERQARAHAERQRSDLAREMENLQERLHQAGGSTAAQTELNKKKEYEVSRLRKDIEEVKIQHESLVASMKKKQQVDILLVNLKHF